MKKTVVVLVALLLASLSSSANAGGLLDNIKGMINSATENRIKTGESGLSSLSYAQKSSALKQALRLGVKYAISNLSRKNGYLDNPLVRIPVPPEAKSAAKLLRKLGQGRIVDRFVARMNHAAERAAPRTAQIFLQAIRNMTLQDVNRILMGGNTATTEYFRQHTYSDLYRAIRPIIADATRKANVTRYYQMMIATYRKYSQPLKTINSIGSILGTKTAETDKNPPENLDDYITRKAIDGIFKMIAREETKIRENPAARTTQLLQKVFGSIRR